MALKETNTVTVNPGNEDKMRALWESFGWDLESKETVRTADSSHLERRGDTIYNVTTNGVHYVKMTFRRDPERKNYAELKSLEERYYSAKLPSIPPNEPKRIGCLYSILIAVCFVFGLVGTVGALSGSSISIAAVSGLVFLTPGILILLKRIKSYPKRLQPWQEAYDSYKKACDAYEKERSEALEKARSLV
jgi:hypothetical protein